MAVWGTGHNLEKNLRKVQTLRERGQLDRALKQLQDWARKYPDTPHYLYEAAMVAFELEDYASGITWLKTLLRTLPDTREKVLTACEERYEEKPALPLAEFLVESHLGEARFSEALAVCDALDPESLELWARKASMRHQSLLATPSTPGPTMRLSHGIQLVVAHGRQDGAAFCEAVEALLELDPRLLATLDQLSGQELRDHPEPADVLVACGLCRAHAGREDEASELWAKAGHLDQTLVQGLLARIEALDPGQGRRGAWWRARGDLSRLAGRGTDAAHAYLEAADEAPAIRDQLLSELEDLDGASLDGYEELLKLRLRLLVVQKRHEEVPPLAKRLREEGIASAQELRALMGERSGGQVAADMLAALAEAALHDGDLGAAAMHANEIPVTDRGALDRVLRSIEELVDDSDAERHLQLMAMRAMLQARAHDSAAANGTLVALWAEHSDEPETLFQVSQRCLEQIEPSAALWLAQLPHALRAGGVDDARSLFHRVLGEKPPTDPHDGPEVRPLFAGTEELTLDLGDGSDGPSDEIAAGLVDLLESDAALGAPFLELVDGCDPSLELAQRLRHAIAVAALQADDLDRALPEFSVLLIMAEPELADRILGQLDLALERHPRHPDLRVAVADLLVEREDVDTAAHHLAEALRADPRRADEMSGRFEALLARTGHETDARLWTAYADALFHAGRFDQLDEVCRKARGVLSSSEAVPIHVLKCRMLAEDGRLTEALQTVQKYLHADRIGPDDAVTVLKSVLAANPSSSIGHLLLGHACTRAERLDDAITAYLEAVRIDPQLQRGVGEQLEKLASRPGLRGEHLLRIARFHVDRGSNSRGARLLDRALRMESALAERLLGELNSVLDQSDGDLDLLGVAATAARHAGRIELGCELLVRIQKRDPERTEWVLAELLRFCETFPAALLPVLCRARVLLQQGSATGAITTVIDAGTHPDYALEDRVEMLQEFHRRQPDEPRLPVALAALLGQKGATDGAIELLIHARTQPGFDSETAIAVTTALLDIAPSHPELRLLHHDLLVGVGRVEEALRALPDPEVLSEYRQSEITSRMSEHLARVQADGPLAATYARSLRRQGRTEDAIDALRNTAERTGAPSSDPLWSELARMLHEAGRSAESLEILRRQSSTVEERRRAHELFAEWNRRRLDGEVTALEERRAQRPQATHLALQLAEKLLDQGRPDRVPEILRGEAPDPEWRTQRACLLARAYLETDQADLAEAVLLGAGDAGDGAGDFAAERQWWLAECAERLGRPADAHVRFLSLVDEPAYAPRAAPRARRSYGHYLEDVAGDYRAVLCRVSSL